MLWPFRLHNKKGLLVCCLPSSYLHGNCQSIHRRQRSLRAIVHLPEAEDFFALT